MGLETIIDLATASWNIGEDFDRRFQEDLGPFFANPANRAPIEARIRDKLREKLEYASKAENPAYVSDAVIYCLDGLRHDARESYISKVHKNGRSPETIFNQEVFYLRQNLYEPIRFGRFKILGGPLLEKFNNFLKLPDQKKKFALQIAHKDGVYNLDASQTPGYITPQLVYPTLPLAAGASAS